MDVGDSISQLRLVNSRLSRGLYFLYTVVIVMMAVFTFHIDSFDLFSDPDGFRAAAGNHAAHVARPIGEGPKTICDNRKQ